MAQETVNSTQAMTVATRREFLFLRTGLGEGDCSTEIAEVEGNILENK